MMNGGCMTRVWINEWWMVDGWQGDDLMNDECGWMTRVLINEWWMVDVWKRGWFDEWWMVDGWRGDELMNDEWMTRGWQDE